MKSKVKARFLPPTHVQDCYSQLHYLNQGNLGVEEYTREFEKLVIKCDLQEPEEQQLLDTLEVLILGMLILLNCKLTLLLMKYVC